jgi:hypothetical protein
MSFSDLEREIHQELRRLPAPRAPRTFAPGVMQAVSARRAEPVSGWFTWSPALQALSLAAMVLLVAGAFNLWPMAKWMMTAALSQAVIESSAVAAFVEQGRAAFGAASVLWRVIEPVAWTAVIWIAVMGAASAAFGAALRNVVLGGTSRA